MEKVLASGHIILIDEQDVHWLERYSWRAYRNRKTTVITARFTEAGKVIRLNLPRAIMGAQPGHYVWHENGNVLDVRRQNLKIMPRPVGGGGYKGRSKRSE